MGKPEVTSYYAVMTYADTSKDGGIGIHGDIILENRMARLIHWMSAVLPEPPVSGYMDTL